jgi:methylase of polypeptide subunit release factors
MEQAKEKVLIFIFFWFFPCFVKSSSSIDWKRRFKKNSKNILDICTGTGVFFVTYGTSKKE